MRLIRSVSLGAACVLYVGICSAGTPDLPSCDSWQPAHITNYTNSSRPSSYPIQFVVIHKASGTAASAVAWYKKPFSGASAHFVFNNSSGFCYQTVLEEDIAWHVDQWQYRSRSVGLEHGGYSGINDTSIACYNESALETKSCIIYYDVLLNRSRILGHSEIPGSTVTDPGPFWKWNYYMAKSTPGMGPY